MKANKVKIIKFFITLSLACLIVITMYQIATASGVESGKAVLDIESTFKSATADWEKTLQKYAIQLFISLITIELIFLGIKSALSGTEKHEVLKQLVMILLFGGFILAVINNHQTWSWQIINFFASISSQLTPTEIDISKPFNIGIAMSIQILKMTSAWDPIDSLAYILTAGIIVVCFALITAQAIYIKCSAILLLFASMVLLGFGGLSFTKEYAINAIKFVLSTAFRLFTVDLVLCAGIAVITAFNVSEKPSYEELFLVIGSSVILLTLVTRLPDEAASILNGSNVSSGMALMQTAGAVAAGGLTGLKMAKGTAAGAAHAAKSVSSANALANLDGKSGLGKAGNMAKTLWNSRQLANADMPGQSTLKRMNSNMKEQIQARKHEQNVEQNVGGNSKGE